MRKKILMRLIMVLVVPGLLAVSCAKKEVAPETEISEEVIVTEPTAEELAEEAARQKALEEEQLRAEAARQAVIEAREKFQTVDIHFDFDSSAIRTDAQKILMDKAEWLSENPGVSILIEGHCDDRGTNEYNLALGDRRATSVKNFLVDLGVGAERLYTISYGEERPVALGGNEEAWSKNRRAHFVIK